MKENGKGIEIFLVINRQENNGFLEAQYLLLMFLDKKAKYCRRVFIPALKKLC